MWLKVRFFIIIYKFVLHLQCMVRQVLNIKEWVENEWGKQFEHDSSPVIVKAIRKRDNKLFHLGGVVNFGCEQSGNIICFYSDKIHVRVLEQGKETWANAICLEINELQ